MLLSFTSSYQSFWQYQTSKVETQGPIPMIILQDPEYIIHTIAVREIMRVSVSVHAES
jgi:hypothetical protein